MVLLLPSGPCAVRELRADVDGVIVKLTRSVVHAGGFVEAAAERVDATHLPGHCSGQRRWEVVVCTVQPHEMLEGTLGGMNSTM